MVIQLLSADIPIYWNLIKYSCVNAEEVLVDRIAAYSVDLLQNLLNDKAQCFLGINNDTKLIEVVCVTQIMLNKERDEKYLEIRCLYSYTLQTTEFWPSAIELIKRFAKAENCKYVVAKSKNQRIFNIVNSVGFQETLRIFELSL